MDAERGVHEIEAFRGPNIIGLVSRLVTLSSVALITAFCKSDYFSGCNYKSIAVSCTLILIVIKGPTGIDEWL
jgi:hypothetical protein